MFLKMKFIEIILRCSFTIENNISQYFKFKRLKWGGGKRQIPFVINTEHFPVDTMCIIITVSFSISRSLPHITDVSWRLEYQIKVKLNKWFYKRV